MPKVGDRMAAGPVVPTGNSAGGLGGGKNNICRMRQMFKGMMHIFGATERRKSNGLKVREGRMSSGLALGRTPVQRWCMCKWMAAGLMLTVSLGAAPVSVELVEGGSLRGALLLERPDRVVLDLGFTVLEVPRESIGAIVKDEDRAGVESQAGTHGPHLFRVANGGSPRSVRDLVERDGEAVVLVRTPVGLGSGFVIHPDGFVVTNDHVIAGETRITVTVFEQDGAELRRRVHEQVRIVATSPELDLALLHIEDTEGRTFKTVALGDSDDLRPGQTVFAVGSPLGLERTVSQGIVSLRNRLIGGQLYVQTTAQISPGNSGGPLFNLRGEVVGVNNMKVVAMGAEGLGFAIPAVTLQMFLRNRDAFAFDPRHPNAGFRYNRPPEPVRRQPSGPGPDPAVDPEP